MLIEVITIGDEILLGQTVDTNSTWLGAELSKIGFEIYRMNSIQDNKEHILQSLKEAESRADVILITGGLGPTKDDITKITLCEYFDTKLVRNHEVLKRIESYFKQFNREMLETNISQADLPEKAKVIDNFYGTASGMWFEKKNKIFVSMPGVPYEMKAMMSNVIIPELKRRYQTPEIYHRTLLTQGIGESFLAEMIKDWENRLRQTGLHLAYLPSPGIVKLRITSKNIKDGLKQTEKFVLELQKLIPKYLFGEEGDTLPSVVGKLLQDKQATLSTAESCTGGNIASMITSAPGSSLYFEGSIISYSNRIKEEKLGVSNQSLEKYGAVSKQVVIEMAEGVRKQMSTDYGIATSGIAGPEGGSDEKPVGMVWIAVSGAEGTRSLKFNFGGNRERNIQMSSLSALNMLRLMLLGNEFK